MKFSFLLLAMVTTSTAFAGGGRRVVQIERPRLINCSLQDPKSFHRTTDKEVTSYSFAGKMNLNINIPSGDGDEIRGNVLVDTVEPFESTLTGAEGVRYEGVVTGASQGVLREASRAAIVIDYGSPVGSSGDTFESILTVTDSDNGKTTQILYPKWARGHKLFCQIIPNYRK